MVKCITSTSGIFHRQSAKCLTFLSILLQKIDCQTDSMYMMVGVPVGVVLLLIGGGVAIFLVKKYKCCHRTSASNNEQEMAPLRSTGRRPLSLAQFRERNNPCRPTEDEFEKMESDARNRNISKSNTTAMEFVNTNIPINRY